MVTQTPKIKSGQPSNNNGGGIPAIEITKDAAAEAANYSDESEYYDGSGSNVGSVLAQRRKSSVQVVQTPTQSGTPQVRVQPSVFHLTVKSV